MIVEVDISWPQSVASNELVISRWSFVLLVASQHALYAHTHALDVLHWTPALTAEQIETNDAVRIDVGMHRNRSLGRLNECDLGGLYRVLLGELELEPVDLILIQRVVVQNPDIHEPFFETISRNEIDTGGQTGVQL